MKTSAQASMGTIDRFIQEVGQAEKRAADPLSEAGSQGGETSHPVKDVEDNLQVATEGERSKENTSDVKEDQGKPSVENAPEAKTAAFLDLSRFAKPMNKRAEEGGAVQTPGSAADDHLQIGTKVAPTGDEPSVETSSAKTTKDNPETTHPTGGEIDQNGPQGGKNASDMSLEELAKAASDLANSICADLTVATPEVTQQVKQAAAPSISEAELASQAGWELAGLLSGNFDKQAADAMVQNELEAIIKTASDDADNVAHYLNTYFAVKAAAEGEDDPAAMMAPPPGGGMPMGGGEGGGPAGPAGLPGGGGEDAMMAAMGGEGGGEMAGGEGGAPDEQVMQLAQILEQLGVTPEELEAAMAQQGGEGGEGETTGGGEELGGEESGGGETGGEGLPPKAGSDKRHTKTAGTKKANTQAGIKDYITEVIQRSRRR